MQQFLPLSHQGFHLGYRKTNFRKELGNETDPEMQKSGEKDQKDPLILHNKKDKIVPEDINYLLFGARERKVASTPSGCIANAD